MEDDPSLLCQNRVAPSDEKITTLDALRKGGGLEFELVVSDSVVNVGEELFGKILSLIEALVVPEELLKSHFVNNLGAVGVSIEENNTESERMSGLGGADLAHSFVVHVIFLREHLDHSVDDLSFSRELETMQQVS